MSSGIDRETIEELFQRTSDEPLFLVTAQQVAQALDTSVEQFLQAGVNEAKEPSFPTSLCLLPEEIDSFVSGQAKDDASLSADLRRKREHIEHCAFCRMMLHSTPPPEKLSGFKRAVEEYSAISRKTHRADARAIRQRTIGKWAAWDFILSAVPALLTIALAFLVVRRQMEWRFVEGILIPILALTLVLMISVGFFHKEYKKVVRHSIGAAAAGFVMSLVIGNILSLQQGTSDRLATELMKEKAAGFVTASLVNKYTRGKFLSPPQGTENDGGFAVSVGEGSTQDRAVYEISGRGDAKAMTAEVSRDGGLLYVRGRKGERKLAMRFLVGEVENVNDADFLLKTSSHDYKVARGLTQEPVEGQKVVVSVAKESLVAEQLQLLLTLHSH